MTIKEKVKQMLPGQHAKADEPAGTAAAGTTTAAMAGGTCETCVPADQAQTFTVTEDRPVVKETVTRTAEHHPVATEFVTETRTRPTGAVFEGAGAAEHLGTTERVVSEGTAAAAAGAGQRVEGQHVAGQPMAGARDEYAGAGAGEAGRTGY